VQLGGVVRLGVGWWQEAMGTECRRVQVVRARSGLVRSAWRAEPSSVTRTGACVSSNACSLMSRNTSRLAGDELTAGVVTGTRRPLACEAILAAAMASEANRSESSAIASPAACYRSAPPVRHRAGR
jgi:hypothetical protein